MTPRRVADARASMAALMRVFAYHALTYRDGLHGWTRHRADFRRLLALPPAAVEQQSLDRLRAMLAHAFAAVPYYRDAWKAAGFVPSPATTLADLSRLPVLTKAEIRERKREMVATTFRPHDIHVY